MLELIIIIAVIWLLVAILIELRSIKKILIVLAKERRVGKDKEGLSTDKEKYTDVGDICPACGNKIEADINICPTCGLKFEEN